MDISKLLLQGLQTSKINPSQGGLRVADYPSPYGLRHGDNAIPKSVGWQGPIGGMTGGVMTEYSLDDEYGDFPSIVPNMAQSDLLAITNTGEITPSAYQSAVAHRDKMKSMGKSPFYDPFLDALQKLSK